MRTFICLVILSLFARYKTELDIDNIFKVTLVLFMLVASAQDFREIFKGNVGEK